MNKTYRFLGKKGRTTIPTYIRYNLNLDKGDLISYTIKENSIVIEKEKLCSNCREQSHVTELVKQMTKQEQKEAFAYLLKIIRQEMIE